MSTIKSSAEHLILNADGSNKEIKFQCNGSEVAKIDSTGFVNAGASSLNGLSDATTSATSNIGLGANAVDSITTGDYNVGVGDDALTAVTEGGYSTAVGHQALATNTTGNHNVAVGRYSLKSATTASDNTAVGKNSAYSTTTGYSNVAIGSNTLESNTTGHSTTAVGQGALNGSTTAHSNVAVGTSSMLNHTTGYKNTCAGVNSGKRITDGVGNTMFGNEAGQYTASAHGNVAIGNGALGSNNVGNYNVCIGQDTRPSGNDHSTSIIIGKDVVGTQNQVHIGTNAGKIYNAFTSNASWTQSSDERLKKNIQTNTLGLNFINESTEIDSTDPHLVHHYDAETNHKDDTTTFHGFIAQEVKTALDTAGVDNHGAWDLQDDGVQGVSIEAMVTPLVKAVQELSAKNDTLQTANANLESRIAALES